MCFLESIASQVLAWNVWSLGDTYKRYAVFSAIQAQAPVVACLLETHLTSENTALLYRAWTATSYHSTHARWVKIPRNIPYECYSTNGC
ncbi:hypothetical protein GDO81_021025 [Engystomops pustulosus]|uniref:Uncharacterized protein n=1 Tax=Engystomops pustulosus TaxID=76066 RepID=A0AAV6YWL3_ENGPU|nr:hypothetical protein GDO81_021025 [Engystomops pustulosus]